MYLRLASVLPYGQVSQQAALAVDPPFLYRFLLPWTLGQLLPSSWLDTVALRTVVTTLSVAVCFWLFPAYAARVLGAEAGDLNRRRLWMGLAVVLLAHYGIPRPYCFWYIYDIPAIVFCMVAFLAMTRRKGQVTWWCVPMLAVLSLNRETIVVAVLHAAAWQGWHLWLSGAGLRVNARAMTRVALPLLAGLLAVVLMRAGLVHWLGHDAASVALMHEGEQLRIVAGLTRIASRPDHALALLLIGAGALVWLPWRWRHLPSPLRVMLVASVPAVAMFLAVGNIVELRMYSELVPVLATCLLAVVSSDFRESHSR
ncbi:hypothetical protein [Aquabacterium sp.]|uniref:hypothetical protein n=1 Tax=Aquabacterium sp. TaxID=1872578 RepID=UPI0025BE1209|nr:hypothetical protein [Aquabacterium sp.]